MEEKPIVTTVKIDTGEVVNFFPNSQFIPKFWYCFPDSIREFINTLSDDDYVLGVGFWQRRPIQNKLRLSFIQIGQTGTKQWRDNNEFETMTREVMEETGLYLSEEAQKKSQNITTICEKKTYFQKWFFVKANIRDTEVPTLRPEHIYPLDETRDQRNSKVGVVIYGGREQILEKILRTYELGNLQTFPKEDSIGWLSVINVGFLKTKRPYLN